LEFFVGRRGDVISRFPSGKVAVVNRKSPRRPRAGEKWLCRVDRELPNVSIVTPITRLVKKRVPVITLFSCGHRAVEEYIEKELPEDAEPEPVIRESVRECPECQRRQDEQYEYRDLEARFRDMDKKYRGKIIELENTITDIKNDIHGIRSSVYMTFPVDFKCFLCRNCGRELELRKGTVTCECGAKYTIDVSVDVDETPYRTRVIRNWVVTDHRREQEIAEEVRPLEDRVHELMDEIQRLKEAYEREALELARSEGIVDYTHDLENRKVTVVLRDRKEITMEWDDGIVIPPSDEPEMLRLAFILQNLPVKAETNIH